MGPESRKKLKNELVGVKVNASKPKEEAAANVTTGTILDLIGQLRIIIHQQVRLKSFDNGIPLIVSDMRDFGEIMMRQDTSVNSMTRIWTDRANDMRYVIYDCGDAIKFDSIDTYVSALVDDCRKEIKEACTFLKEPERIMIGDHICYSPTHLGIPWDSICRGSIMGDYLRDVIRNQCSPIDSYNSNSSMILLNVSCNLRCEALTNICGFDIEFNPIEAASILKMAGISTNRPSYMNDIIGLTYNAYMGPQCAAFIGSLLAPGEILIDIDYSDIAEDDIEYRGIAAIMVRSLFTTDYNSTFNNISEESLINTDLQIARWGYEKDIIERIHGRDEKCPLNNFRYKSPRQGDSLETLQIINGVGGMNCGQKYYKDDSMSQVLPRNR